MRIVVTGGSGYCGSVLVPILIERGHEVWVCDPKPPVAGHKFSDDVRAMVMPDHVGRVIHMAGTPLDDSETDPNEASSINAKATWDLAQTTPAPMLFFSTCSVYGRSSRTCTEKTRPRPTTVYADTKLNGECEVLGNGHTAFRFATMGGYSDHMRWDTMINQFVIEAVMDHQLTIMDPGAWRPFVDVRDVCDAVLRWVSDPKPGLWNVVGHNVTKNALATIIKATVDGTEVVELRGSDKRSYRASGAAYKRDWGALKFRSLDDTVRHVMRVKTAGEAEVI